MTLTELLTLARSESSPLALAIIDLLGEAQPCGLESATAVVGDDDGPWISADWLAAEVSPADARAMARMLLTAAEEAEARHG